MSRNTKGYSPHRIVVAACTPRMHEPTFKACAKEAGMNPYLVEMANIREHCSWVHTDEKEAATDKANDLVRMSAAIHALSFSPWRTSRK